MLGLAVFAAGCASDAPTTRGEVKGQEFNAAELLQSEANRTAKNAMLANQRSLLLLADKLYRRNPAEWRKTAASREAALAEVEKALSAEQRWAPLAGKRDVAALTLALSGDFSGDRVAAFIIACNDTIVTAHGGKRDFYYLDSIDPQHIFNAARNMETALWVLNTRRDARGQPLLLSNEITADQRNLSFEREFGKIIGRLDLLASTMTERYRRAAIGYVQGLALAPVLAFLPVK
ncbi:hypothetical protein J1M35_20060 [Ottowia testudinis]|uniref:Uncharacterized protein n=2 Tax=Ottowia testudinis TaxID=2816950 RepID=A0A975H5L2_9BURK|nr:hypothetical protein [Ottowia testudinis]QTD47506.1 hypothetical protein J1M35_20060 [Ottowia testudinis]